MELGGYIKLIYQSAFGCGHILTKESYIYLKEEYSLFPHNYKRNRYIPIGNNYVRLDLAHTNMSIDNIYKLMKDSYKEITKEDTSLFESYLITLLSMSENKEIPLSKEELLSYINKYKKEGTNIPSHSLMYKEAYHPSYRGMLPYYEA